MKSRIITGDFKKVFVPMAFMAAFLPILVVASTSQNQISFSSKASDDSSLRIWIEPKEVTLTPGKTVKMQVVGELDDVNTIAPQFEAKVLSGAGIRLSKTTLTTPFAFRGRAVLGQFEVTGSSIGDHTISIDTTGIKSLLQNTSVIATPANISVRPKI